VAQQAFQRELNSLQQQQALLQLRERLREDKSPITNLASDLLENSFAQTTIPLKVLLSPPSLDYDPSSGKPYQAGYEGFLSNEIEQFLHQGYLSSEQSPVQLVDKSWESSKHGGGSALQALHGQLKSIPILVLDSEIALGELNFRVGYWAGGDVAYKQASILSRESVSGLLNQIAKQLAAEWQITRQKLQDLGKDDAYIKTMGGIHEENLQILQGEVATREEFSREDVDITSLPIGNGYKIVDQHYKSFYEYLAVWHCLVIGHYTDQHFLARSWKNTPLLPSMIPYLMQMYKGHPLLYPQFWQKAITETVKLYSQFYNSLADDASSHLPEIRIKLAFSLANLPQEYQYFAFEQAYQALSEWLAALNVPADKVFNLEDEEDCQLLKQIIYQEDQPFLEALQALVDQLGDVEGINLQHKAVILSLLAGWQRLQRFGSIPHVDAVDPEGEAKNRKQGMRVSIPRPEDNFTEKLNDDLELEMIAIPAGEFMMGSQESDQPKVKYDYFFSYIADHDAASPAHRVRLPAFYLSKHPITQAQYQAIMGENPSHQYNRGENKPVEQVNWTQAKEFCQKLSETTGRNYQLPSESQWEYACRAGTTTRFFFGDNCQFIRKYGHVKTVRHVFFLDKDRSSYYESTDLFGNDNRTTVEVNHLKPNPWGLHDLLGNVWEWCQDDWFDGYLGHPCDGSARVDGSGIKVVRGGCFNSTQIDCYSFSRRFKKIDTANEPVGFRVVC
jgi:formylglycine-generating enzyme required for sulfatase activity